MTEKKRSAHLTEEGVYQIQKIKANMNTGRCYVGEYYNN